MLLSKLSGTAYEGLALHVFIRARSLADEHQLRAGIAHAEDDLLAALLVQAAASAIAEVFANGEQGLSGIGYGRLGSWLLLRISLLQSTAAALVLGNGSRSSGWSWS